jgi:serine/threonine protein kinase
LHAILTVRMGGEIGRQYVIGLGERYVIGRGQDAGIRLEDDRVSRAHVALEMSSEGLLVTDLGSSNGSYLGISRLEAHQPQPTKSRDKLLVGHHTFFIRLEGDASWLPSQEAETSRLRDEVKAAFLEEFTLLGQIGRGAVGTVFAAHQELLGRDVAVKVLDPRPAATYGAQMRKRSLREARISFQVKSPYVVEVFDVRLVGERVCIVMELVNGPSAMDCLAKGPFPIPEALKIAEDVARALEAAHAVGVIHRDVKPDNIFLSPDGMTKLGDFGIAKADWLQPLTVTGEGLGTLAYMAPEQATAARHVGGKADLYGLGATLFHMISGGPPFDTSGSVLRKFVNPAPPLTSPLEECPPRLAELVGQLLAKAPEDRPADAATVVMALADLRKECYPSVNEPTGQEPMDMRSTHLD